MGKTFTPFSSSQSVLVTPSVKTKDPGSTSQEDDPEAHLKSAAVEFSATDWLHPTRQPKQGNTTATYIVTDQRDDLKTVSTSCPTAEMASSWLTFGKCPLESTVG